MLLHLMINMKHSGMNCWQIPTLKMLDVHHVFLQEDYWMQWEQGWNLADTLAPVNADIKFVAADQDFISTYGVKVVAGSGFSRDFSLDTSAFLINEAAVKVLGLKINEDAIGKNFGYGNRKGKIIGVFNDFHFESLHQKIFHLFYWFQGV